MSTDPAPLRKKTRQRKLLAELLAAVREQSAILTGRPWDVLGVSRSNFYRLMAQHDDLRPVKLASTRPRWRVADLKKFAERLPRAPRRRPKAATSGPSAE